MALPERPKKGRTEMKEEKVERRDRFDAQADRSHHGASHANTRATSPGAPPWVPGGTQAAPARAHAAIPAAALGRRSGEHPLAATRRPTGSAPTTTPRRRQKGTHWRKTPAATLTASAGPEHRASALRAGF